MDTVLAEPALLGTLRQANPKGNALKHCLGVAFKTRHWVERQGKDNSRSIQIHGEKQQTECDTQVANWPERESNICPAGEKHSSEIQIS